MLRSLQLRQRGKMRRQRERLQQHQDMADRQPEQGRGKVADGDEAAE
jgi:hypothetical protein